MGGQNQYIIGVHDITVENDNGRIQQILGKIITINKTGFSEA